MPVFVEAASLGVSDVLVVRQPFEVHRCVIEKVTVDVIGFMLRRRRWAMKRLADESVDQIALSGTTTQDDESIRTPRCSYAAFKNLPVQSPVGSCRTESVHRTDAAEAAGFVPFRERERAPFFSRKVGLGVFAKPLGTPAGGAFGRSRHWISTVGSGRFSTRTIAGGGVRIFSHWNLLCSGVTRAEATTSRPHYFTAMAG